MTSYKDFTALEGGSLITWKNNETVLNAYNMNKLTDRVEDVSNALKDESGDGVIPRLITIDSDLYGSLGNMSLVDKIAQNSWAVIGYSTDKGALTYRTEGGKLGYFEDCFKNTDPLGKIDSETKNFFTTRSVVSNDDDATFWKQSTWNEHVSDSLDSIVDSNKERYGALSTVQFHDDLLRYHHEIIRSSGEIVTLARGIDDSKSITMHGNAGVDGSLTVSTVEESNPKSAVNIEFLSWKSM